MKKKFPTYFLTEKVHYIKTKKNWIQQPRKLYETKKLIKRYKKYIKQSERQLGNEMGWKLTFADDDVALEVDPVALREPEH